MSMEFRIKIHSIVITLSIFVFALIAVVVEIPNTVENVLAQQPERSSQQSEEEEGVRDLDRDRTPQVEEQRSSLERYNKQSEEEEGDRDIDRLERYSQQSEEEEGVRDLDRDRTPQVEE